MERQPDYFTLKCLVGAQWWNRALCSRGLWFSFQHYTHRDTLIHTHMHMPRDTVRDTHRGMETQTHSEIQIHTDRLSKTHTDRHSETHKPTLRDTDTHSETQTPHTERHTHIETHIQRQRHTQ